VLELVAVAVTLKEAIGKAEYHCTEKHLTTDSIIAQLMQTLSCQLSGQEVAFNFWQGQEIFFLFTAC
jgi:hypothetical protein